MSVSLLFTCDLHGRLGESTAGRLRELKAAHDAILLDGGDAISAGNVTIRPGGEPILRLMASAGYDAMVVGNREYFVRQGGFRWKLSGARFPALAANIESVEGGRTEPWIVLRRGGMTVGIAGFAREMVPPGAWWGPLASVRFLDLAAAARRVESALRTDVDLLVALSHLGAGRDRELAALGSGIDLILAGHEHPAELTVEQHDSGPPAVYAPAHGRGAALVRVCGDARPFSFDISGVPLS